jgi:hypothetical protein
MIKRWNWFVLDLGSSPISSAIVFVFTIAQNENLYNLQNNSNFKILLGVDQQYAT